jgi:ADP-heptose:LPS heptosyltransferase
MSEGRGSRRARLRRDLRRRLRGARDLLLVGFDSLALLLLRFGLRGTRPDHGSVAVFNLHGAGDLLLSLPCLEQLRRKYPAGRFRLTLYCRPAAIELGQLFAPVDHVVGIDRSRFVRSLRYRYAALKETARKRYAVAVQPTFNRTLSVEDALVRATGAAERIGSAGSPMFGGPLARRLGDRWYYRLSQTSAAPMHELERYDEFLRALELSTPERFLPDLALPDGPPGAAPRDYVLVVPDSSNTLKSWPIDRFEQLAHQLADLSPAALVFAGTADAERPRRAFQRWRDDRFIDLTGCTSSIDLLRLIKGARLVVTNDSGGLHMAVMLGRPVVAIVGGGLPGRYHPYPAGAEARLTVVETPLPCYGCNWSCIHEITRGAPAYCIASVTVSQVLRAVRTKLQGRAQPCEPRHFSH